MRLIDGDELLARVERNYGIVNLPWFIREIKESKTVDAAVIVRDEKMLEKIMKGEKDNGNRPEIL